MSALARGEPQDSAARKAELAGDLPVAERAYEVELKARPSAEKWQRLGLVRHLQNKFASAILAFREATRLNASLWTSHLFLGIGLYRTNQFQAALDSLSRADRLAPKDDPGRDELDYWLGAARIALKQPLAGLTSLERLLMRNPKHREALELASRTYASAASGLWNDVAERNFETAAGWEVHGHALESENTVGGAMEAYQRSRTLNPKRPGPRLAISRLLLRIGKAEEALAVLKEELTLARGDPETAYYAGLAAVQLGRHSEAAPLLDAAARWGRKVPEAALALTQVYLALRDPAKAVQAGLQAVSIDPSSAAAHEVLEAALEQAGLTEELRKEKTRWADMPKQK